jgi:predicted Zn-dependent protease
MPTMMGQFDACRSRWVPMCVAMGMLCASGALMTAFTLAALPALGEDRPLLARPVTTGGQLAYEPVALHWSAAEVELATAANFDAIVSRAQRQGQLGCEQRCTQIQHIFERLLPLARAQSPRAQRLPWALTVVRSTDVEAMALPGGHVLVSEAFIQRRAPGDEALAFVLAHEMAHSILEHERQTLHFARMLLRQEVSRTVDDMYVEIGYSFALLTALEPVMQQGEFEADELGLLLASAAGFDPQAQLAFMTGLMGVDTSVKSLVQSHPPIADRLSQLRARLPLALRVYAAAPGQ